MPSSWNYTIFVEHMRQYREVNFELLGQVAVYSSYYQDESATYDGQVACPLCLKKCQGRTCKAQGRRFGRLSSVKQHVCLTVSVDYHSVSGISPMKHEQGPHCLVNMMATYNTLEKKLVDIVSACHCYVCMCMM